MTGTPADTLPARYAAPVRPSLAGTMTHAERARLESICARPEIAHIAGGLCIHVVDDEAVPFFVLDGGTVRLGRSSVSRAAVRHAAELALWHRLAPGAPSPAAILALGALSCRVAALGEATKPRSDLPGPDWLKELYEETTRAAVPSRDLVAMVVRHASALARLSCHDLDVGHETGLENDLARSLERCWRYAAPVEVLLTTGGDSRLRVDPDTQLNGYGCSPRPRPEAITFASCTATSISTPAYAAAEDLRQSLLAGALFEEVDDGFVEQTRRIKRDILQICGADADSTDVVLTASGTDAELCVLQLCIAPGDEGLTNLVVGPGETGSSVGVAASGRHFDGRTALDVAVPKGALLEGLGEGEVRVEMVPIRRGDGSLLPAGEVDDEVVRLVELARMEGRRIVLHVLDTSKTGLLAPSPQTVDRLRRESPGDLDVIVDACQLRMRRVVLREYLDRGCMVLMTGSKFFTGPPFAGAILIPRSAHREHGGCWRLPGLRAYSTRWEWPEDWNAAQGALSADKNLGLLLRWRAALWEMQAFDKVPTKLVTKIVSRFGRLVDDEIRQRPHLRALEARPLRRGSHGDDEWDTLPTVFPFAVTRKSGRAMTMGELRNVYEWLNRDLSAHFDPGTPAHAIARTPCHIGQPVLLGHEGSGIAALRIAAGARLSSGVAFDPGLGTTPEERLQTELQGASRVFEKLDLIVEHYETLARKLCSSAAATNVPDPHLAYPATQ